MSWTPADIGQGPIHFVAQIVFAGRTFRLATNTLHISEDGVTKPYLGTLEPVDWAEELNILSETPQQPSVALEATLDIDVSQEMQRQHVLGSIRGSLWALVSGQTLEQARPLLLQGYAVEPEIRDGNRLVITLSQEPQDANPTLYPPVEARVTDETWGASYAGGAAAPAVGRSYPTVFGRPGYSDTASGSFSIKPGSKAYLVGNNAGIIYYLLIGLDQHVPNTVTICGADNTIYASSMTPTFLEDDIGRRCAVVILNTSQAGSPDFQREFFVRGSSGQDGWGIPGDSVNRNTNDETKPMDKAGDIAEWALRRSGYPIDWGSVATLSPQLNRYRLAGAIDSDEPIDLLEWTQQNVFAGMPIATQVGPHGIGFTVIEPAAWATQAAFHFVVGRDGDADGDPVEERGHIVNRLRVRWALDRGTNAYDREAVTVAQADLSALGREIPSSIVATSQARYGVREGPPLDLPMVYEERTAHAITMAHLALYAHAWVRPIYVAPPKWLAYPVGTPGLLTHPERHYESIPCVIRANGWAHSQGRLELLIIADPHLHFRQTA